MTERYTLKRRIEIEQGYDIVVAGGGPSGAAAAICAGRLGMKVLLIESTGCMGGMGTSGLVSAFDPMANGEQLLVGGLQNEIVMTLYERGDLGPREKPEVFLKKDHHWTAFRPEGYKCLLDELSMKAGVEVRFFTRVIDTDADPDCGEVYGVILHNIEGYRYIRARAFIDCTGDAVLADLCGAACREAGKDTPRIMPATLPSHFCGVDWNRVPHPQCGYYLAALKRGEFSQYDRHLPGMSQVGHQIGYLNGGHLFNLNALRCRDLSDNVMLGRRLAKEYYDFYRKNVPGCEKMELVTTASLIGVRESRRIVGEYELNINDYLARRQFPDQIGIFSKFIDIHPYDTTKKEYERFLEEKDDPKWRLGKGEFFGIPYGVLVPRGWKNLWVAGRCASADVRVHGSIRVQPAASMMGQAAGTAAVLAIRHQENAASLNTERLVNTLREANAILPQPDLTRMLTREHLECSLA